eukprot:TRINITY_DN11230_c0_g1_i1.p1 TRINITY_DN11230_c0_g1~~TRINITY_DN11230_c0_g1_i1.p1  ORF type:complete len:348 (+),score=37.98 TRINITY_DN11230_c0_g1_i1:78-1046(+)
MGPEPYPKTWGNWTVYRSKEGRYYYANKKDKSLTTWDQPKGWGVQAAYEGCVWWYIVDTIDGLTCEKIPADESLAPCHVDNKYRDVPRPLKWKRWKAFVSKRTGRWFYFDEETQQSTWYQPHGWGGEAPTDDDVPQALVLMEYTHSMDEREETASLLCEWLRTEGSEASFLVDSGDFSRPLTKEGVLKVWDENEMSAEQCSIFTAYSKGITPVGHIEVLTHTVEPNEVWCHWAACSRYSFIAYVYIIPFFRARHLGTAMVTKACQHAFSEHGSEAVFLLIQETNEKLLRFYTRIGFSPTEQTFIRNGERMLLLRLQPDSFVA